MCVGKVDQSCLLSVADLSPDDLVRYFLSVGTGLLLLALQLLKTAAEAGES